MVLQGGRTCSQDPPHSFRWRMSECWRRGWATEGVQSLLGGAHLSCAAFWSTWAIRPKNKQSLVKSTFQGPTGAALSHSRQRTKERPGGAVHIWTICANKLEKKCPQNALGCLSLANHVRLHDPNFQVNIQGEVS